MRRFRMEARWRDEEHYSLDRVEVFEWRPGAPDLSLGEAADSIRNCLSGGEWIWFRGLDGKELFISPDRLRGAVIEIWEVEGE